MKMTLEQLLADEMVRGLLGEYFILTEDRIDDLVARYNATRLKTLQAQYPNESPQDLAKDRSVNFDRRAIESWMEFDPSRNKKYLPWIVMQVATGNIDLSTQGEEVKENLMTFERLITIPDYDGPRDLYQIKSLEELNTLMSKYGTMKSKTQAEREKKMAGQESVAKAGNLELLKITVVETLNHWSWRAYSWPVENPNWAPRKPANPKDYATDDLGDRKWCTRWPRFATTYLSAGPFYMVLRNGGPYVGIQWEKGECQDLTNKGINTAIAEEIYPVVKDFLPEHLNGNCRVFANMKFLYGDVKEGETHAGPVDLANTKVASLPANTTIRGTLDLTNCPITQLPANLRVEGTLKISGTGITVLPDDLFVEDMEWSEPLTLDQTKQMFWRMRLHDMEVYYKDYYKTEKAKPTEEREKDPKTGKPKRLLTWNQMRDESISHFLQDKEIDKNIKTMYRYTPTQSREAAPEQ
jgi:hypothetical protein